MHEGTGCADINECQVGTHECAVGTFCVNSPGSVDCQPCHHGCDPAAGCTAAGSGGCTACRDGWERGEDGACADRDECLSFPCSGAESCTNTADGGYTCACSNQTAVVEAGVCVAAGAAAEATVVPPGSLEAAAAEYEAAAPERVQSGVVHVLSSPGAHVTALRPVRFEDPAFLEAPRLAQLEAVDVCCGDTFELGIASLDRFGFTLVVRRTDSQQGWGQEFNVRWRVVAPPLPPPAPPIGEDMEAEEAGHDGEL